MEEFGVRASGWDALPTSEASWDEGRARAALNSWAGDDMAKYGRGFLWSDGSGSKTGFKFPIAMPVDGRLTVFLHAVSNAKARMNSASVPDADKARMMAVLNDLSASYDRGEEDLQEMSLVAAAAPLHPPRSWFEDPKLQGPTKITVTDEGQVFGHLGLWNSCHLTFANTCVTVPKSRRNYADFHVGSVKTAEGQVIDTGVITVDTGHADTSFTLASRVKAHYDDTGTQAAIVRMGEDQFGVWYNGSLVPGATEETAQKLRRTPLSGDWRRIGGGLELVAALGVNRPAFAVTASGEPVLDDEGNPVDLDTDVVFRVEDDEVVCLIAAFGPGETMEDFDADPIGEVDPGDGCGCPDVKAALASRVPLAQRKAARDRLAQYQMIGV